VLAATTNQRHPLLTHAVVVLCWDQGAQAPQILPRPPKFLIGSVVISLGCCCLPNDEGPGPQIFFPRTSTGCMTWKFQAKHAICIEWSHWYHPWEFPQYWPLARFYRSSTTDLSGMIYVWLYDNRLKRSRSLNVSKKCSLFSLFGVRFVVDLMSL